MRDRIIVVGSLNYDIILDMPRLPERGESLPADGASHAAGGKGANQAVQAAKLGMETYMAGCVGDDAMGGYLIETAAKYGVNTQYIRTVPGETGMGIVNAVQNGEVYASVVRGANFEIDKADIDNIKSLMKTARIVILQLEIPIDIVIYTIAAAKEAGCSVMLNTAPALEVPDQYLAMCDVIIANEVEAAYYLKEEIASTEQAIIGGRKLAERWDAACVITLGREGSAVVSGKISEIIPAAKVSAVDTTGAGDSFIGALSYALGHNMGIVEACRFATECSAITVCGVGAQSSMPLLADIKA